MHPVLFEIGPLTIRSYGAMVALAFITGFALMYAEARRLDFFPEKILDLELYIILSGVAGARVLHVLADFDYYRNNIFEAVLIWRGGLAIYGGIIFAVSAGWFFIKKNGMPLRQTGDFIAPYIALGQSIGRIGCFMNGCCFGKLLPGETLYRYPTQIYSSAFLIVLFVILKLRSERPHAEGTVFSAYLIFYSMQRFAIDFLRGDLSELALGLTITQFISIAVFLWGIFLLIRFSLPR
jgi:phosphatidylglycerol:prolipoprotein diacylglycerol transferase